MVSRHNISITSFLIGMCTECYFLVHVRVHFGSKGGLEGGPGLDLNRYAFGWNSQCFERTQLNIAGAQCLMYTCVLV